ncbi:MAG: hypothetical protein LBG59_05240 [Candidatus Peribacteria bacterium]|jgi:hypothetical protein|nr:hypothetical protein [Candidatus Peribacteria bacterium]
MYYRASQGYITIEGKKETTLWFFVKKRFFLHKSLKFDQAMGIHQLLLQNFFRKKEKFKLSDFVYNKFESYKKIFEGQMKLAVEPYRIIIKRKFLGVFPYEKATLNEQGQHLYEEIRGFAYFLGHVEEPRLKQMLKDNPYYIDEVLPRAVLFGVETEFLKAAEQYIGALQNPEWYS